MTPMEERGLLKGGALLLALSLLRVGLQAVGPDSEMVPQDSSNLGNLLAASRAEMEEEERRSAPLGPDEMVDPNRDGEVELDRLPGIGPVTARAVVAEREANGGFADPQDLLRVRGIGPSTLEKVRPHLDFSRSMPLGLSRSTSTRRTTGREGEDRAGQEVSGAGEGSVSRKGVDVNRAPAEVLQTLPGIGPVLSQRLLDSREEEGPFRKPEDLLRVKGIGPVLLARIRPFILTGGGFP